MAIVVIGGGCRRVGLTFSFDMSGGHSRGCECARELREESDSQGAILIVSCGRRVDFMLLLISNHTAKLLEKICNVLVV
jgi:hypothetical protein